jgi:response regulator RpfG family c-di-GMP phosphodiesterase
MSTKSILIVDDEVNVLNSLSRTLSKENIFDVKTAQSGREALEIIANSPDLALIVTDYHMPGMNGIELLAQVRKNSPDVTRILLTGAAEIGMALDAVNKGSIFRFLLKPCPPDTFLSAVMDGFRQTELIMMERDLLRKTLFGSIKVLIDILAVTNPGIFAQAGRLRNLARDAATALHLEDLSWEIELAALLSQIGAVTIPRNVLERWQCGEVMEESEIKVIKSIPRIGRLLIINIPRLKDIAEAVGYQNCSYGNPSALEDPIGNEIPLLARILKVIIDFDGLMEKTKNPASAIQTMQEQASEYDPSILREFRHKVEQSSHHSSYQMTHVLRGEKEVNIGGLRLGMVLSRDVVDKKGIHVISKGAIVSDVLLYKLINSFNSHTINESVFIESAF